MENLKRLCREPGEQKSVMKQAKIEGVSGWDDKTSKQERTSFSALYQTIGVSAFVVLTIAIAVAYTTKPGSSSVRSLPPGAVFIDPLEYNVVGAAYTQWRTNNSVVGFNPTNAIPPFIQVFDPSFLDITGPNATIRLVASKPGFAFAHEAPIYVPDLDVVFFSSNGGGPFGYSGWHNNSVVSILNMTELDDTLTCYNEFSGHTNPDRRALLPPSLVLANPSPPFNTTVMLDNFYGRQFNSLNDIKILPGSDLVFFTDPTYGWMLRFRPQPMLPSQVYRFDPSTGHVRVVADQFVHPNGIAFTANGRTAYVSDSGVMNGLEGINHARPATIYQFDVDPVTHSFTNRRVFAYSDSGIPDGIQVDTNGNVYSGCGDGAHVWNSKGTLIGKFFLNSTSANMVFTKSGLLILAEESIYLTDIQAQGIDLAAY
ncbi:calcium-dependent phosphotriesterase [Chiua virens]|nr:calcium-dependent phosphotriesterase [Chiua virens]